ACSAATQGCGLVFLFSSRRRHTSFSRDWSSDVCSSDLGGASVALSALAPGKVVLYFYPKDDTPGCTTEALDFTRLGPEFAAVGEIGRASCRERVQTAAPPRPPTQVEPRIPRDERRGLCF